MNYHKLLTRQISKYLSVELAENPAVKKFLSVIDDSYEALQRDKLLAERAFSISEEEYIEINIKLKHEIELKKKSIEKLKNTLGEIGGSHQEENPDDLLAIAEYLNQQIIQRKSAEKVFTSFVNNSQSGILLEDENRKIVFTNQAFCNLFKIDSPPEILIGADCSQSAQQTKHLFKTPEEFITDTEGILEKKIFTSGNLILTDERILRREYIPIFIDEKYKGHLWSYTDITEKKKAEEELEQSELKNRLIMNSALDAIITIDNRGLITFWNPQAEKTFGWKEEEVIGKRLSDIIIPSYHKIGHENGMDHYSKTGHGPALNKLIELPAINVKGEEFQIELSIIPVKQGNTEFFCSFIRDITDRKLSEQALSHKEEKYRNIIANMNLGLIELDNNGYIQFANQSFCKMSGFNEKELINAKATELLAFGETKKLIKSKKELRTNAISDAYQTIVRNKDGKPRWWLISDAPRLNDKGEHVGSIGIHLDITEQKKLENELIGAKEAAEASIEAKEAFLANMSHEIRTPMNAISGMANQLKKTILDQDQQFYLNTIRSSADNLLVIINDILDLSKIESGKLGIEKIGFEPKRIISQVMEVMQHRAEEKGLKFTSFCDQQLSEILIGDPFRLSQIMTNLVSNAIKFTPKGKVDISCKVLEDLENEQVVEMSVEDTGVGMEKVFIAHLFEKFSQEDNSVTRKYGGTGLGMSICKELIELMEGKINVISEKNKGTIVSFILRMPKGRLEDLPEKADMDVDTSLLNGKKILVTDDNEINRLLASTILLNFGAQITEATNGEEAFKYLNVENFDLILMDIQMPVMDGLEATKLIRKNIKNHIPIIALTAFALKGDNQKCFDAGMDDYLSKPFEETQLLEIVSRWLGKSANLEIGLNKEIKIENPLFDLSQIEHIARGDQDFINKMIALFTEELPMSLKNLSDAYLAEDFEKISKIAHHIKPSIENIGIVTLIEEVREIEKFSEEYGKSERLEYLLNKLDKVLNQVIAVLKKDI